MSKVSLAGNASGTGIFTIASPNSNTDRTLTLPNQTGTLLTNASTAGFPAGSVLQVVNSTVGYVNTTSTTPVDTGLTASITPSSATSKILVNVNLVGVTAVSASSWGFELTNASNTVLYYMQNYNTSSVGVPNGYSYSFLFSPATTSSLTYKVRYYVTGSGSSIRLSDYAVSNQVSTITLMEIAG
jgi:hypothetical protein